MSKYPIPFGRHLLLERINVGGMAEVFQAKSFGVAGFERIVAVKRILPTLAEDEEFITMFIDEARIAAHLTHQNIVQIYELGSCENNYYISMEYVGGRDLRQILDLQKKLKKPMDTAKSCFIVSQVCEALEYAHRKRDPAGKDLKIIHRDVTPQNVIVSYEGEVKLCDFGIAKAASRASRTQVGVLKGKFAYMSPEQVRGQPTDRRSDLFALGIIFYEMLTGERLFLGESDYSTLEAVRNARVPSPRKFNPNLSKELEAVVLKLLTRDPNDRYQWASEVHEDLQDHLVHEGRVFHVRHLRASMQETYARDIEIENAKLEEFMSLGLPERASDEEEEPSESLLGLEEEKGRVPEDPANYTYAPIDESAASDDTDHVEIAVPRLKDSIPTRPIDYSTPETKRALEGGPIPAIASASPVSNIFGAPELSDERKSDPEANPVDAMVIVPGEPEPDQTSLDLIASEVFLEDTPYEQADRTLFDMAPLGENDTLFDERDETQAGDEGDNEIAFAEKQLMERLDLVAQMFGEETDTIDATGTSEEIVQPSIHDPSEPSLPSGSSESSGSPRPSLSDDSLDDDTSISPMVLDDESFAPTMVQSGEIVSGTDNTEDETPNVDVEEGTIEEAPAEMIAQAVKDTSDPPRVSSPKSSAKEVRDHRIFGGAVRERSESGSITTPSEYGERASRAEERPGLEGSSTRKPARRIREKELLKRPEVGSPPKPQPISHPGRLTDVVAQRAMPPVVTTEPSGLVRAARDPVVLMLIAAAVGLLSVSVLAFTLFSGGGDDTTGSLQILTEPTRKVEVKLDGVVVGFETPVDIPGIELGMHQVELSAEGYRTYTQRIQIAQAKPHTMVVPLEPSAEVAPKAPEVTAAVEPSNPPIDDSPPPPAPPPPVPAVRAVDRTPPPPPPVPAVRAVDRTPPPPPPVRAVDRTPPPASPPPARPVKQRTPPPTAKAEEGFLIVATRPPGLTVMIDGKSTGLRTPIRHPHPLPPGTHHVAFIMDDGSTKEFDFEITAGATTKLVKTLR